jgi:hypothetical protein
MSEKKNYVGNGKAITNNYGTLFNITLKKEAIEKLLTSQDGNYIKITMSALKEVGKYGETHTVYENTYKSPNAPNIQVSNRTNAEEDLSSDLPF